MSEVYFDVGVNYGEKGLRFLENNPSANIYAFEPLPQAYNDLKERTKNLENYHLFSYAVDIENGKAMFNVSDQTKLPDRGWNGSSSLLFFNKENVKKWSGRQDLVTSHQIEVEKIRLDTFIEINKIQEISFINIDTQGNDLNVLKSLGEYYRILLAGTVEVPNSADVALYINQHTREQVEQWLLEHDFNFELEKELQNEVDLKFFKKI